MTQSRYMNIPSAAVTSGGTWPRCSRCSAMKRLLLLILILFVKGNIIIKKRTVIDEYSDCIKRLVINNFKEKGLLIVANAKDTSPSVSKLRTELLKILHVLNVFPIQIISPDDEAEECRDHNRCDVSSKDGKNVIFTAAYYVLILDGFTEFKSVFEKLRNSRTWNPRASFIIFLFRLPMPDTGNRDAERILTYVYKHNVLQIVVLMPCDRYYRNIRIYSWKPYDPPNYCGYINETAKGRLIEENYCARGVLEFGKNIFYDKIPKNMSGCTLNVIALLRRPFVNDNISEPGIERHLIEEVSKHFRFKLNYELSQNGRGERDGFGEWTGALRYIDIRHRHLLFGGIFPDNEVHEDFESTSPYLRDSYTWVVPRAKQLDPKLSLLVIYNISVWLIALTFFFFSVVTWKLLAVFTNENQRLNTICHCLMNALSITLGFPSYIRPLGNSLRLLFGFFSLYCLIFLTAYQAKLIDVLTNPFYQSQVHNVDEMIQSGLRWGGLEEVFDLYENSSEPEDQVIKEGWIFIEDTEKALVDVTVHRNFSLLCSRLILSHVSSLMPQLSDNFGEPAFYAFEDNVFTVPMETVVPLGFPFLAKFNQVLYYFKQMGINAAICKDFVEKTARRRMAMISTLRRIDSKNLALTMRHLQGGFLIILVGYVTGCVIFIIELILGHKCVTIHINHTQLT